MYLYLLFVAKHHRNRIKNFEILAKTAKKDFFSKKKDLFFIKNNIHFWTLNLPLVYKKMTNKPIEILVPKFKHVLV